jgi:hypothetical protein
MIYTDRSKRCWTQAGSASTTLHTQCNFKAWVPGNTVKCWCFNCERTTYLGPLVDDLCHDSDVVINLPYLAFNYSGELLKQERQRLRQRAPAPAPAPVSQPQHPRLPPALPQSSSRAQQRTQQAGAQPEGAGQAEASPVATGDAAPGLDEAGQALPRGSTPCSVHLLLQ